MRYPLLVSLTSAILIAAACSVDTNSTDSDTTTSSTTTSTSTSTSTTTSSTTGEPTTSTTDASGSTTSTTEPMPACETSAMECGVDVSEEMSSCPDPQPTMGSLEIEVLGPGSIRETEIGFDANCNLTYTPVVNFFSGMSIFISYEVGGQPMDGCMCKYTISSVISNIPAGTWNVTVGPHSQMVEVP